ncbi:hypothetical protein GZ77_24080 [Endozoicomonas montiporae]|uniref:GlcNAc-PI de-N-acetylase n=1 Tax=Endozoicomonas montiporae TaxID=1027273 RepID=A0A081MZI2_9GAMM|nr:hypothetical protein GZ77_24080 [Endozoicomonas montiporae]
MAYILKEAFWADHIHYDVSKDQTSTFNGAETCDISIKNNNIELPEKYLNDKYTLLLELTIKSTLSGYLFDPYLSIQSAAKHLHSQYFERGAKGKRYLNITHSIADQASKKITLDSFHCSLNSNDAKLIAYKKPELKSKKILVISPHPDDAEIAAFGTYSNSESFIVTVSAGEKEADDFARLTAGHTAPELIKGKLRAHDSLMVPLWAGKSVAGAVNLGYFDDSLKQMFENKSEVVERSYSDTTLPFRAFNTVKLTSDEHGTANWQTLVSDLKEVLLLFKPDIIITPDQVIDHHIDHQYSTTAVKEAQEQLELTDIQYLYYANHIINTDHWPFGPAGTLASLPPLNTEYSGIVSIPLNPVQQINKHCALEMMHDLRSSKKVKIKMRYFFQELLARRPVPFFGAESYYRKNVKSNEIFFFNQ